MRRPGVGWVYGVGFGVGWGFGDREGEFPVLVAATLSSGATRTAIVTATITVGGTTYTVNCTVSS
jgi:hypothetical protein